MKDIIETLRMRATRLRNRELIARILGQPYILAGGAMRAAEPRDYDIYGVQHKIDTFLMQDICRNTPGVDFVTRTNNALTVKIEGQIVQFCKYFKPTPKELVESFDFTHVQAGAVINNSGEITDVVYTNGFEKVENLSIAIEYTGSEYPLSSLKRLIKFLRRGDFKDVGDDYVMGNVLRILCDVVKRDFSSWADFRDQCASISGALYYCDASLLFHELRIN